MTGLPTGQDSSSEGVCETASAGEMSNQHPKLYERCFSVVLAVFVLLVDLLNQIANLGTN